MQLTNHEMRRRLAALDWNAKLRVNATGEGGLANADMVRWCRRNPLIRSAPIFIATTEDIGTLRCRSNHLDAGIHYCEEQEALRLARAPI